MSVSMTTLLFLRGGNLWGGGLASLHLFLGATCWKIQTLFYEQLSGCSCSVSASCLRSTGVLRPTEDTCTYDSLGLLWTMLIIFYVKVDLASEVDSQAFWTLFYEPLLW